jgi:hypothetical protein
MKEKIRELLHTLLPLQFNIIYRGYEGSRAKTTNTILTFANEDKVAENINRLYNDGKESVPAETLVIASEQQSDLANGAVAEEDIKLVFGFAKNIAKVFDRERSSNVWFWIQQAMPDKADRWEDVQELLDKILRATASL